jgi:hypothetical protein
MHCITTEPIPVLTYKSYLTKDKIYLLTRVITAPQEEMRRNCQSAGKGLSFYLLMNSELKQIMIKTNAENLKDRKNSRLTLKSDSVYFIFFFIFPTNGPVPVLTYRLVVLSPNHYGSLIFSAALDYSGKTTGG